MTTTGRQNANISAEPHQGKVRVGLALASPLLAAWEYRSLEKILKSDRVVAEFVVFLADGDEGGQREPSAGVFADRYLALDRKRVPRGNDALRPIDATDLLGDTPVLSLESIEKGRSGLSTVDVVVQLGFAPPRASLAASSRHGLWYHPESTKGVTTGFHEMMAGAEVATSTVRAILPSAQTVTLSCSYGSTSDSSPGRMRNLLLWKSSSLLARQLRDLADRDPGKEPGTESNTDLPREYPSGTSVGLIRHLGSQVTAKVSRRLFLDQWHLLYHLDPSGGTPPDDPRRYTQIIPPTNRFWADPFVIAENGKYYVFIEESLMKPHKKGFISVLVMDPTGAWEKPVKVIEQPYHLSYPFMFTYDGELFMIPESGQNKTIDLYRCEEFPFRWKHHGVIMNDVRAVDTTLLFHEDRWWMFTTMVETEGASLWDELYLFWSKDPTQGPWVAHPGNPVLSDARRARPAGAVYTTDGKLYRPSQDCGKRYGFALNINEIIELNTMNYHEHVVRRVEPPRGSSIKAIHTLNSAGGLTVMDGILRRRRFP